MGRHAGQNPGHAARHPPLGDSPTRYFSGDGMTNTEWYATTFRLKSGQSIAPVELDGDALCLYACRADSWVPRWAASVGPLLIGAGGSGRPSFLSRPRVARFSPRSVL